MFLLSQCHPRTRPTTGHPEVRQRGQRELRRYSRYSRPRWCSTRPRRSATRLPDPGGLHAGKRARKFAMTAPVTQTATTAPATQVDAPVPLRMDMTAPVTQSAVAGGMRAARPAQGVMLATAPEPPTARTWLREVPGLAWAVIRYQAPGRRPTTTNIWPEAAGGPGDRRRGKPRASGPGALATAR